MPMQLPPISHVEDETKPIEAVASAPRLPTIPASMYCIAMDVSCARIAGRLMLRTSRIFSALLTSRLFKTVSIVLFFIFPRATFGRPRPLGWLILTCPQTTPEVVCSIFFQKPTWDNCPLRHKSFHSAQSPAFSAYSASRCCLRACQCVNGRTDQKPNSHSKRRFPSRINPRQSCVRHRTACLKAMLHQ